MILFNFLMLLLKKNPRKKVHNCIPLLSGDRIITAVAAPLVGAKLLQGLLRGWPQHRGFGGIMSPTEGGHQGQVGPAFFSPVHVLWSISDHACRTDWSSGGWKDECLTHVKRAEALSKTAVPKSVVNS